MLNKYEQQKQLKHAIHKDMEMRVSTKALEEFHREAYPIQSEHVRDMLTVKRNLIYLQNRAGMLDYWERETIRRIVGKIQKGDDNSGKNDKG